MNCKNCGQRLADTAQTCPICGAKAELGAAQPQGDPAVLYCKNCGQRLADTAKTCPVCGGEAVPGEAPPEQEASRVDYGAAGQDNSWAPWQNSAQPQQPQQPKPVDEISIPYCLLAYMVPIFGIFYYINMSELTPRRARACGIIGLLSVLANFVIMYNMMW